MINDNSASIVSKVWNYAHVLKNAGVGYGDYVEQITYLLFPRISEQHKIVAESESHTTAIAHLEAERDRQISCSNRLRQSVLSDAFSGRLSA
jgi:hypothetical protein